MKTVSLDFEDHLDEELTTLATCWHIIRRDGVEFFFTDHDRNLIVDGDEYLCAVGYSRTAIANDMTLAVDNLDVMGFLDNETITDTDLRAGTFDFAQVYVFAVNWADLTMGILKQRRGWLGEVTMGENGVFKAELRGLTQALSQRIGEVYSPECRATPEPIKVSLDDNENAVVWPEGAIVRLSKAGDSRVVIDGCGSMVLMHKSQCDEYQQLKAAHEAAKAPERESGWQLIETCPKCEDCL